MKDGVFSFLKGDNPMNSLPLFLAEQFFQLLEILLILILFHSDIPWDISFLT